MTKNWTPGPWQFYELQGDDGLGYIRPFDEDGKEIAHHGDSGRSQAENVANARLIAAAPELYEALNRLLASVNPGNAVTHATGCRCVIHEARAALARARGETT